MRRGKVINSIPKRIALRIVLTVLVIVVVALAINIQPAKAQPRDIIATCGEGYLEDVNSVLVLHVKGSPYEMGYQHGFLLKDRIQAFAQYLIQKMINVGYSYEYMVNCVQAMESHIPQEYIDEMKGLADGASMNYTDALIAQLESGIQYYGHGWTGCSGFVVFGNGTSDGHLYHGRSLDWSLCTVGSIGLIIAYEPENGNTFVNVGQIGMIGVSTGMNTEGITAQLNISYSTNRTLDGMPVSFILRKVLQYSDNLTYAIDIISQADRTQGYNILLGDGRNLNGAAVEVSQNYCKVFWAGDTAENITPHYPISNTVRRTNHYVDPELASTQRPIYDPRVFYANSWDRYELLSQLIEDNYGNIDAQMSIEFLRTPPVAWAEINLQSMVFDSTDLELWVADSAFSIPAYQREFIHLSCDDLFPGYPVYLTTSSTAGGNVTTPGEGTYAYAEGTLVDLVAEANEDYQFAKWTATAGIFDDVNAAGTNFTMPAQNVTVTAQFTTGEMPGDIPLPPSPSRYPIHRPTCFIATAAYGTPMAEEIQTLREFRDGYLLTNPLGRAFVDFYYKVSPPIAEFITEHPSLKPIVRAGLVPAVAMSTVVINTTAVEKTAIVGLPALVSVAVVMWIIRRRNRDSEYA